MPIYIKHSQEYMYKCEGKIGKMRKKKHLTTVYVLAAFCMQLKDMPRTENCQLTSV